MAAPLSYPALWYTSRTPTDVGQSQCAYRRWAGYHAGRHGTGYRRISLSIPLATGGAVHMGLQFIGEWVMEFQAKNHGLPPHPDQFPKDVIAWAASEAARRYEVKANAREIAGLEMASASAGTDPAALAQLQAAREAQAYLIAEQATLIEACVWAWATIRLPDVLAQYRILDVEREESIVLACTCGLGEAVCAARAHAARGCMGIVQQGRADWLLEGHAPEVKGAIVYTEFKTKAMPNAGWEKAWEHSGQLFVNMEAASRRLGAPVKEAFVEVLLKGIYAREDRTDPNSPKRQQGPLCYGWHLPANPPMHAADWMSRYRWTDEMGKGHQVPKSYNKVPIWDEQYDLPPCREGASRVETWVTDHIGMDQWPSLVRVLGPFPRPVARTQQALAAIIAEEEMWRQRLATLRAAGVFDPGDSGVDEFGTVITVDAIVPRSWNCTGFDGSPCEFAPVCNGDPGWQHPADMGTYLIRRPHHAIEREACEAVGVVFPPDEDADEEDGNGE